MPNWLNTINIYKEWNEADNDETKIPILCKAIVKKINETVKNQDEPLKLILKDLENIPEDFDEFNFYMNKLYDWADLGHRLFINWMFEK